VAKVPFIIFLINFLNIVAVPVIVSNFLFYLSVLSIVFGALAGLYQVNLMRMLAFGTISHAGFILLGLSIGTIKGFSAALVYLVIYVVLNIGTFASIMLLKIYGYKVES
jgi:NADH-quinone oxidoreductase subunit N